MLWIWYRIEPLISPYPQALDRYRVLVGKAKKNISAKDRVDHLYSVLSILDTKASSLMTFDGVLLAVLAIFARDHTIWALVISLAVLISMVLCLWVAGIMWRFLELCEPPKGSVEKEIDSLCKVMGVRERAYQWAWALSLISVITMTVLVLAKLWVAVA